MYYFVTETPQVTIYLPAEKVKWLTTDTLVGTWKTENETSAKKMREYASRKVGGAFREVGEVEFLEIEKKTSENPFVPQRESVGGGSAESTVNVPSRTVAAPSVAATEPPQPAVPAVPVEPVLRKRGSASVPK